MFTLIGYRVAIKTLMTLASPILHQSSATTRRRLKMVQWCAFIVFVGMMMMGGTYLTQHLKDEEEAEEEKKKEDEHEDDDERSGRRRIQMKMQMGSQTIRVGLNPTPNR